MWPSWWGATLCAAILVWGHLVCSHLGGEPPCVQQVCTNGVLGTSTTASRLVYCHHAALADTVQVARQQAISASCGTHRLTLHALCSMHSAPRTLLHFAAPQVERNTVWRDMVAMERRTVAATVDAGEPCWQGLCDCGVCTLCCAPPWMRVSHVGKACDSGVCTLCCAQPCMRLWVAWALGHACQHFLSAHRECVCVPHLGSHHDTGKLHAPVLGF